MRPQYVLFGLCKPYLCHWRIGVPNLQRNRHSSHSHHCLKASHRSRSSSWSNTRDNHHHHHDDDHDDGEVKATKAQEKTKQNIQLWHTNSKRIQPEKNLVVILKPKNNDSKIKKTWNKRKRKTTTKKIIDRKDTDKHRHRRLNILLNVFSFRFFLFLENLSIKLWPIVCQFHAIYIYPTYEMDSTTKQNVFIWQNNKQTKWEKEIIDEGRSENEAISTLILRDITCQLAAYVV